MALPKYWCLLILIIFAALLMLWLNTSAIQQPEPSCAAIMNKLIASAPATQWPPPCPLPESIRKTFEGPDGSTPHTRDFCQAQRYEGELVVDWNKAFIDKYCEDISAGKISGSYTKADDEFVRRAFDDITNLGGSTGMVWGSERPWVECFGLIGGASTVWTFEYATIVSGHPQLKAKPYKVMAADHIAGTLPLVDWIASYSSLEHSGLGRYGDALNPDGDTEALQQALCFLKPGGLLLLGLPMTCRRNGYLEFNAHRFYGYRRLAYVAEGFEVVKFSQPCRYEGNSVAANIVILRKPVKPQSSSISFRDFERAAAAAEKGLSLQLYAYARMWFFPRE